MKILLPLLFVFGFAEALSNRTASLSMPQGCSHPPPMLEGASLYVINTRVAKYNCLPPYRGHAYSRCHPITRQWSRVNLTCVNVKLPPDQTGRKTAIGDDVLAAANALTGIQLSDHPAPPPNTYLVATQHYLHQVVTAATPKRPRADTAVKTCGIPPHIPGTVFIVINEFMVKYACIDEHKGAVRWKNYAYYFCTPEQRTWRGSPPECGMGPPTNDADIDEMDISNKVRLRARKLQQQQQQQQLSSPVQHQPRALGSYLFSPQMSPKSVWMGQQQLARRPTNNRLPTGLINNQAIRAHHQYQVPPPFHQRNNLHSITMAESNDALLSTHLPSVAGMAMRDRRTMSRQMSRLNPLQQQVPPDWNDLVTSSSAQLSEPLAPPPVAVNIERKFGSNMLSNDRRLVQDKDLDEQRQIASVFKNETRPSPANWERLKLRSENEFSVATIGEVVMAQDVRRQNQATFAAAANRQQRQHSNNNEITDDEAAEEEERSRRLLMSKKQSSQWDRCDSTRACTTSGPRIGRRASVVYRSFNSEQACPGDFVRIACQSGHNTSWHTSFCTHRRYWTFVPACGG